MTLSEATKIDPIELAFIQPTPFCNIDCKYCFLPARNHTHRMSSETLRQTFAFLFRETELVHPRIRILWHAGEPLAAGIDFYEEAFSILKDLCPAGIAPQQSMQSNGTLLNDAWCDLIEKWNISIGISLDGPQHIHDANRVDRAGRGTFARVLRGIEALQRRNISFHIIGVVSEHSLDRPDELWSFYRSLGITNLHFLIEELQGIHTQRELRREDLLARVERFFSRLLHLRENDPEPVHIRELDNVLQRIRHWPVQMREVEQFPVGIINVSWDGKVSTLSPDLLGANIPGQGPFYLGEVGTATIADMLAHPAFQSVYKQIFSGFRRCQRECSYFCVCGGGQPSVKLYENGGFDTTETPSCIMRIQAATNVMLDARERNGGLQNDSNRGIAERIARLKSIEHEEAGALRLHRQGKALTA